MPSSSLVFIIFYCQENDLATGSMRVKKISNKELELEDLPPPPPPPSQFEHQSSPSLAKSAYSGRCYSRLFTAHSIQSESLYQFFMELSAASHIDLALLHFYAHHCVCIKLLLLLFTNGEANIKLINI